MSLPDNQRARLRKHLRRGGAHEIGGILMGEHVGPDHFCIVDFSVDDATGTPAHFVRSPEHHATELQKFFQRTGSDFRRFNYLGEWHSHPSYAVRPSHEDVASMQSLVDGERDIDFSVLLIVRLRCFCWFDAGTYMFVRHARHYPIVLTR